MNGLPNIFGRFRRAIHSLFTAANVNTSPLPSSQPVHPLKKLDNQLLTILSSLTTIVGLQLQHLRESKHSGAFLIHAVALYPAQSIRKTVVEWHS